MFVAPLNITNPGGPVNPMGGTPPLYPPVPEVMPPDDGTQPLPWPGPIFPEWLKPGEEDGTLVPLPGPDPMWITPEEQDGTLIPLPGPTPNAFIPDDKFRAG